MFQVDFEPTNGGITYIIHSKVHYGIICIVLITKNMSGIVSSQITDCLMKIWMKVADGAK